MTASVSIADTASHGSLLGFLRSGTVALYVVGAGVWSAPLLAIEGVAGEAARNTTTVVTTASNEAITAHNPVQLIESMSVALRTLNYEGVFVHAKGTSLTSMHILHANGEEGEKERLSSLDGEAREVFRTDTLVTCIWPDSKSVEISRAIPRDHLPRIDASLAVNPRYELSLAHRDRVAGRSTHVVNVMPLDDYRYGYRFWIDVDTNMLLRSMLLQHGRYPIEQLIFTQISYPEQIDDSRFDVISGGNRSELISWLEPEKARARSGMQKHTAEQSNRVSFTALPEGYRKVSETYSALSMKNGPMSHVMISDGMASVSVYVEYVEQNQAADVVLGLSRMGAMNAYGISTRFAVITAVGEVPEATVRAIAAAVILNE